MNGPVGITIDSLGNLFVAMCNITSVYKITSGGVVSTFASRNLFACPNGITFDDHGNLYVCNFSNGDVLKVTPAGAASLLATLPGANNGQLDYLDGFLYVAARGANQIYKVSLGGEITLFAGTGQQAVVDGPVLQAAFNIPNAVTFSLNAIAFYTNGSGSVIRKIQLGTTEITELSNAIPSSFVLEQNHPNPFNPSTKIIYSITEEMYITLKIIDVLGNEIATLVDDKRLAGTYEVNFTTHGLAGAVYFFRMNATQFYESKKLLLLK